MTIVPRCEVDTIPTEISLPIPSGKPPAVPGWSVSNPIVWDDDMIARVSGSLDIGEQALAAKALEAVPNRWKDLANFWGSR